MSYYQNFSYVRFLAYAIAVLATLSLAYFFFILFVYLYQRSDIGRQMEEYKQWVHGHGPNEKKPPIRIYASNSLLLGEYLPERGSWMTMPVCSRLTWLKKATILSEDRNFYSHGGIDYRGIARAAWRNITSFSLKEGGGTLSQQLARNLFTNHERSFFRKLYETLIAFQIEGLLTKDEILCLYLNKIYMGEGRIGAEEASWFYFAKAPWLLNVSEAAMLVGLFPSPTNYSPLNNISLSLKKQRIVLDSLVKAGELSHKERNLSFQYFKKAYQVKEGVINDPGSIALYGASRDFRRNLSPTVNEYVKNFLYQSIPEDLIRAGDLRVYTTIDPERQALALKIMRQQIAQFRQRVLIENRGMELQKLKQLSEQVNGVFVSMDPFSGKLLAVVGGYRVGQGSLSQRVWSMLRQPGSSIKGFLYAVAIDEQKLNFRSTVLDEPLDIHGYSPRNWNNEYLGEVPLRQAIAMSINTVAVKTLNEVGVAAFRQRLSTALDLGFFEKGRRFPKNLSLALGSAELTPLELNRTYSVLVNGGHVIRPQLITSIENRRRQVLWKASNVSPLGDQIFSQNSCVSAIKLLESVFDESLRGTASLIGKRRLQNSNYLPFAISGKTGTVQITHETKKRYPKLSGVKDLWFVGLVPKEVSVLWFGHDHGAPISGTSLQAALAWADYAQRTFINSENVTPASKTDFYGAKQWEIEQQKQQDALAQETQATQEEQTQEKQQEAQEQTREDIQGEDTPLEQTKKTEQGSEKLQGDTGFDEQNGQEKPAIPNTLKQE